MGPERMGPERMGPERMGPEGLKNPARPEPGPSRTRPVQNPARPEPGPSRTRPVQNPALKGRAIRMGRTFGAQDLRAKTVFSPEGALSGEAGSCPALQGRILD
jgi:hypothetical protein